MRKNVKGGNKDSNAEAEELAAAEEDENLEKQSKVKKMKVHFSWDTFTSFGSVLEVYQHSAFSYKSHVE